MCRLHNVLLLGAVVLSSPPQLAALEPEIIRSNENRVAAGSLRNGKLTLTLEARVGIWRPQADDGGGVLVLAFGEPGKSLLIPGPLMRVRSGASISVSIRNTLPTVLIMHGLHTRPGAEDDTLHVPSGALRTVTFEAGAPGTYYYWGSTTDKPIELRDGDDSQLTGAFIIDPASGAIAGDRVFVLGLWFSPASGNGPTAQPEREIMVINGKSWPNTERISQQAGDVVRWHWINATASSHPMHLHGFYFKLLQVGDAVTSRPVPEADRRELATQLMMHGQTMLMEWSPVREGNWVFHCHFAFHVSDELYLAPRNTNTVHDHGAKAPAHSMAGLVLGIHVAPRAGMVAMKSSEQPRRIRLLVQQRSDSTYRGPKLGYALSENGSEPNADSMGSPGPILRLRRGQPVAITVVNRLKEPTAVHWHGIELESFPDGVPGWSGTPARIMPPIAPQDSFVAEFVPPRSGTFIYHSHSNELGQILGGLVGPLIVQDDDAVNDRERVFLISSAGATFEESRFGLVNGRRELTPMELRANETYNFRFINIGDWRVIFALLDDKGFPPTRMIAKDGADLPRAIDGALNMITGPGETADFQVKLPPGRYRLEFKQQVAGWIVPLEIRVR